MQIRNLPCPVADLAAAKREAVQRRSDYRFPAQVALSTAFPAPLFTLQVKSKSSLCEFALHQTQSREFEHPPVGPLPSKTDGAQLGFTSQCHYLLKHVRAPMQCSPVPFFSISKRRTQKHLNRRRSKPTLS